MSARGQREGSGRSGSEGVSSSAGMARSPWVVSWQSYFKEASRAHSGPFTTALGQSTNDQMQPPPRSEVANSKDAAYFSPPTDFAARAGLRWRGMAARRRGCQVGGPDPAPAHHTTRAQFSCRTLLLQSPKSRVIRAPARDVRRELGSDVPTSACPPRVFPTRVDRRLARQNRSRTCVGRTRPIRDPCR